MSNEVKVYLPKYVMSYMNRLSQHMKYFSKTSSCSTIKWEKYGKEWEGIVCEEVKILNFKVKIVNILISASIIQNLKC